MIADYLYNTPAPPAGSTVAVVLFATAYEDSESLNTVVQGKTLAEIAANSNTWPQAGKDTFGGSGKQLRCMAGRTSRTSGSLSQLISPCIATALPAQRSSA